MTSISNSISNILNNYYSNLGSSSTSSKATTDSTSSTTKLTNTSLKRYLDSTPSDKVDAKAIFEKVAIDLGGDTKSITKDNLDAYIKKAEKGTISISDEEMSALTELQGNWGEIDSNGDGSISYTDVSIAGYKDTLLSVAPKDTTSSSTTDLEKLTADATASAYSTIVNAALGTSTNGDSTSGAKSLLNTLLTGTSDKNDDSNGDLIDKLVNIIATSKKNSTVETEA